VDRGLVERVRARLMEPTSSEASLCRRPPKAQTDHLAWVLGLVLEHAQSPTPFPDSPAPNPQETR
jgi:hypothetical protein